MRLILTALSFMLFTLSATAATVISCNDGDTCRFNDKGRTVKVRISGIDAPEKKQTNGEKSRKHLLSLLKGQQVTLECEKKRSYDRKVCKVLIGNRDIAEEMVLSGWAWDAPKHSKKRYAMQMKLAQEKKLGIWQNGIPTTPHCYRRKNSPECQRSPASP